MRCSLLVVAVLSPLLLAGCMGTDEPASAGHVQIEPGAWDGIAFTVESVSEVTYAFEGAGDVLVATCLLERTSGARAATAGEVRTVGCLGELPAGRGSAVVGPGAYTLGLRCMEQELTCSVSYEIMLQARNVPPDAALTGQGA